jgi:hypothetical protein
VEAKWWWWPVVVGGRLSCALAALSKHVLAAAPDELAATQADRQFAQLADIGARDKKKKRGRVHQPGVLLPISQAALASNERETTTPFLLSIFLVSSLIPVALVR